MHSRFLNASVESDELPIDQNGVPTRTPAQMEAIVRQARQTFGETLPADFLSVQETQIYERLYGPPSALTTDEDLNLLAGVEYEEEDVIEDLPRNVLIREGQDGKLEEIIYEEEGEEGELSEEEGLEEGLEESDEAMDAEPAYEENELVIARSETQEEFHARVELFRAVAAARTAERRAERGSFEGKEEADEDIEDEEGAFLDQVVEEYQEEIEEEEDMQDHGDSIRTHPLTAAGRFGTSPATIQLPKDTIIDPITALLADSSNKQLSEVAQKTFGGPGLPNSTATIKKPNTKQEPVALEASQFNMGDMEGNAFMAAIMPGAYAASLSTLVEVRKRLGSDWLRGIMRKGPRILDAGAGGAAVLAWREVLKAEWESLHPDGVPDDNPPPYGKSTVVTGSAVLRHRASQLLDNTTFIPRLPDYDPSRDHPSLEPKNPQPRKQYDVILAPHTLWTLKEDYMRKNQIQNFWSLLDPRGGVLVLIEKGVPRGFELIAGARETLLKHHVSSPGAEEVEHTIEDASENRFGPKEKGMIIAPCTNHGKCPMYITAGQSQGRKDYCHFSHRFIRPPYLQRILGVRDRNHEDIKFSYVALQRGVDQRLDHDFEQGHPATAAAFEGYEDTVDNADTKAPLQTPSNVNTLTLPRAILPPIKRRGHVILDLCTPSGKIERWTVPRSFSKQAYRDARKSKWGDLWALGAKTRVQRNIRVGLKKTKSQVKNIDMDSPDDPEEGERKSFRPMGQNRKKPKHKKRMLMKDDV
ncbi:MAG: hypothetical protein Q9164_002007 [Protoblastenia rupestris]